MATTSPVRTASPVRLGSAARLANAARSEGILDLPRWTPAFVLTGVTWSIVNARDLNVTAPVFGRHVILKDLSSATDQHVLVKVRSATPASGLAVGPMVRASGAAGAETLVAWVMNGSNAALVQYNAGTFASIGANFTFTFSAGVDYWMRLEVVGSTARGRVWAVGSTEPGTWQATGTTTVTGAGQAGLFCGRDGPYNIADFHYAINGATVASPALPALVANDVAAEKIYQRAAGVAPVALSGSYTESAPASIEAQLYAADGTTVRQAWTALSGLTAAGGSWSGTLSANAGGMYRFAVRSKNASGTVLVTSSVSTNLWGVGDLVALVGSSSAGAWAHPDTGTTPANANVRRWAGTSWGFSFGGAIVDLVNALQAQTGFPVGYVVAGQGGSTLQDWQSKAFAPYAALVTSAGLMGGKLAFVLATVGSNDADTPGLVTSKASHLAKLQTLMGNLRTDLGQPTLPWFFQGSNRRPASTNGAQFTLVHEAEKDLATLANVYHAPTIDLEVSADNVHMSQAGYQAGMARLTARVVNIVGGAAAFATDPAISAITYTSSAITVTVTHGGGADFTPTSGITGFTATDDSGALAWASAVRTNATTITLTPTRAIVGVPVVQYLAGANPIAAGGGVKDNGGRPLLIETEMVATV